ncbi:MAG: Rne/Rng family ribonuclease [Burkholderiales bacterium]
MKRMLFNATQAEELRVAIVDGQKLIDLDIEYAGKEQRKSNIYKGVITRVEPSLEACFVEYGADRHGFLPFKEISKAYMQNDDGEFSRSRMSTSLKEGTELIVQVDKDERGNKGAALTTFVSLAGRYLVLMPNNPRGGGVSRRIEGEERAELRDIMDRLEVPEGMSLIARTAGIGRSYEELQWDMNYLLQLWHAIDDAAQSVKAPELIYLESSLVVRAIRDLFQPDIGEILIDTESIYEQAQSFMSTVMPANVNKVKLYKDDVPLFSRFQIEHQIETAYRRDVPLPSGGAIIIDHTEALVSVDVNSARATKGADIEATAFNTNLEAADEVARQLRLRDLGGLVVIDFIDMESARNQREVENRLRDALKPDRARVQTGKISRFGLMELSRQRLQPSLGETSHIPCPRCHGTGHIRDTESSALHILRILQEEAMKENTLALHAQVPVDVATYLLNEKRAEIHAIESRLKVDVVLIPNTHLETPNYEVERVRQDSSGAESDDTPSYQRMVAPVVEETKAAQKADTAKPVRPVPLVKGITPAQPAPITPRVEVMAPQAAQKVSIFRRMLGLFRRSETVQPTTPVANRAAAARRDNKNERDRQGRDGARDGGRNRNPRRERNDAAGAAKPESAQAAKPPREPREIREPREPREPRPPRETREPREAREPKEPRGERRPRITETEETVKQDAAPVAEVETRLEGEGRQRRRRGGRGRGDRGDRGERTPRDDQTEVGAESTQPIDQEKMPALSAGLLVGGTAATAAAGVTAALREEHTAQQEMDLQAAVPAEGFGHGEQEEDSPVKTPNPTTELGHGQRDAPIYTAPAHAMAMSVPAIQPEPAASVYDESANGRAAVPTVSTKLLPPELVVGSAAAAGLAMVETRPGAAQPAVYSDQPVVRVPRTIVHDAMPSADDLIQVETHPAKRIAAQSTTVSEYGERASARRNLLPPAMPPQNEALIQVETQK